MMRLDQINEGDVLSYWHDGGDRNPEVAWAKAIRKGKVLVEDEHGVRRWVYAGMFNRVATGYIPECFTSTKESQ